MPHQLDREYLVRADGVNEPAIVGFGLRRRNLADVGGSPIASFTWVIPAYDDSRNRVARMPQMARLAKQLLNSGAAALVLLRIARQQVDAAHRHLPTGPGAQHDASKELGVVDVADDDLGPGR